MPLADVFPAEHAGPILSAFAIAAVTLAVLGQAIAAFARALRRRALAAAADASFDPERVLAPGDTVLRGTVELAADETVAVRVEITQTGEETENSGKWGHRWTEIDRKITVAPFYLRLAGGQRVRVEPPEDVDVADDLDGKVLIARDRRVLSAELVPGETIYARGRLEQAPDPEAPPRGYREKRGFCLVAVHGRMLLSSHALGDGLRSRARFHRNAGLQLLAFLVPLHLLFALYHVRALGTAEEAEVTALAVRVVDDGKKRLHQVTLGVAGDSRSTDVSEDDYARLSVGSKVMIRRGSIDWQIGPRPTLHAGPLIIGIQAVLALWIFQRWRRKRTRPWYRQKLEESASGRLSDPEPDEVETAGIRPLGDDEPSNGHGGRDRNASR